MRSLLLTTLFVAVSLSGCGDDDSSGPQATLPGTYALQTVNGSTPPVVVVQSGTYKLEITAGNVIVNASNTFSDTHTLRETDAGTVTTFTETCTGTLTQSGNSVTFTEAVSGEACGGTFVGTWSNGNTLTIAWDATIQAVYRK